MTREEAVGLCASTFMAEWAEIQVLEGKIRYKRLKFSHPVASYYENVVLKFYICYDIKSERFHAIRSVDEVWLEERN